MEAVAARITARAPEARVCCAYLELTRPDLPTAAAELVAAGCQHITIVPMFLGVGKHAREDLPMLADQLTRQHPLVQFVLQPAIGEDPRVVDLLARVALAET